MAERNLIERLENLIAATEESREMILLARRNHVYTFSQPDEDGNLTRAKLVEDAMTTATNSIEDAEGIAGEILTMIDGR